MARSERDGRIQPGSGHWLRERPMDAKARRKVIAGWLAKLQRDMMAAVEQMPDDWDETELGWYLMHRAGLFHRSADRLRRKAYEHALRSRRL
jgi:hypothetical protein